jgi:VanZ family protein
MTRKPFFLQTLPPFLWAALLFFLSNTPGNELPVPTFVPNFDKIAHFGAYGVLGLLIIRAGKEQWLGGRLRRRWFLAAWALACLYGLSDEWHQSFVPLRSSSLWDWLFDAVGSGLGAFCWLKWL